MVTFDEAIDIRNREGWTPDAPASKYIERESFWWFADVHPHIGSQGIIIDKADGHPHHLGSGLGLEEWFYAHELGFRHRSYLFQITAVRDVERTLRILWDIRYTHVRERIKSPPLELEFNWMCYGFLPRIIEADFFDYQFSVLKCDYDRCTSIGSRILCSKSPV